MVSARIVTNLAARGSVLLVLLLRAAHDSALSLMSMLPRTPAGGCVFPRAPDRPRRTRPRGEESGTAAQVGGPRVDVRRKRTPSRPRATVGSADSIRQSTLEYVNVPDRPLHGSRGRRAPAAEPSGRAAEAPGRRHPRVPHRPRLAGRAVAAHGLAREALQPAAHDLGRRKGAPEHSSTTTAGCARSPSRVPSGPSSSSTSQTTSRPAARTANAS